MLDIRRADIFRRFSSSDIYGEWSSFILPFGCDADFFYIFFSPRFEISSQLSSTTSSLFFLLIQHSLDFCYIFVFFPITLPFPFIILFSSCVIVFFFFSFFLRISFLSHFYFFSPPFFSLFPPISSPSFIFHLPLPFSSLFFLFFLFYSIPLHFFTPSPIFLFHFFSFFHCFFAFLSLLHTFLLYIIV